MGYEKRKDNMLDRDTAQFQKNDYNTKTY